MSIGVGWKTLHNKSTMRILNFPYCIPSQSELTFRGIDFDDPDYGFKEENKPKGKVNCPLGSLLIKAENEKHFRGLATSTNGTFATMAEVISSLAVPRVKKVRPIPSYRGVLTIGDPNRYDDAIAIDVERYPRTKRATPLSASKYLPPKDGRHTHEAIEGGSVTLQRTYKIKKGEEEVEVEKEELQKAYLYGRTIVNLSDADLSVTKLETTAELAIIGFVSEAGV
jgi:ATP-dependent DNA helicase 2 subunit 2